LTAVACLGFAACGGSSSGVDAGPVVMGPYTHFVTNTLLVPTSATQANDYGLDLDMASPSRPDNALGNILSTLAGQGVDVQTSINTSIMDGSIVILHSVQAANLMTAGAAWHVYLGQKPANPPMFNGMDMFTLDSMSSTDAKLVGQITGGHFVGGPGSVPIKIALVAGQAPLSVTLVGARIDANISATACDGKLGGAITKTDLDTTVIPTVADLMNAAVMKDCPTGMGCTGNAQTILNLFDKGTTCMADSDCPTNAPTCAMAGTSKKCTCPGAMAGPPPSGCMGELAGDGKISVSEIAKNPLIVSLLAPDVDLLDASGTFQADPAKRDGMKDSLSLGVKFTCVPAMFTAPGEM
jgi:hypothetical protein